MVNTGLLKEYKEQPCWLKLPEVPLYIHKLRVYIQNCYYSALLVQIA